MEKALLISRNLPPLIGGMERLMLETAKILSKHYQLSIIGPRGSKAYFGEKVKVYQLPSSPIVFIPASLLLAVWLTTTRKCKLVIGGSGVMAPAVVAATSISNARSAIFLHGLDIIANNVIYQRLFVPAQRHINLVIANSTNTKNLAISKGIKEGHIKIIHPGTSLPTVDRNEARRRLSEQYHLDGKKLMLSVGRITPRKGLKEFVQHALPLICNAQPNSLLIVAGDHPENGLKKSADLPKQIAAISQELGLSDHILFLGNISDEELSRCYAAADCLIFPLIEIPGDVEGFGMVAIEAAAHGTPTIAFNTGGISDAINEGDSGHLIPTGNYKLLADAVLSSITTDSPIKANKCIDFAKNFHWDNFECTMQNALEMLDTKKDTGCLAIASTPLHLIYIIEFAIKYGVEKPDLIILLKRKTDQPQIENIIKEINWNSIRWLDATSKLANKFISLYELYATYIIKTSPNGYRYGVFADYGRSILANVPCRSIYWLGDGTKLLYEVSKAHDEKPNRHKIHRIATRITTTLLKKSISLAEEPTIFSPFEIPKKNLVHNEFHWLKSKYSQLSNDRASIHYEKTVHFFGSYFSEVDGNSLMPDNIYINYIKRICLYYQHRKMSIIYVPHRHESASKLAEIEKLPNLNIRKFSYPAEYQFLKDKHPPRAVAAFCSTCLFNFHYIFKDIEIKSFYADFSAFNKEQSEKMETFYDHLKLLIGHKNVIDLESLECPS